MSCRKASFVPELEERIWTGNGQRINFIQDQVHLEDYCTWERFSTSNYKYAIEIGFKKTPFIRVYHRMNRVSKIISQSDRTWNHPKRSFLMNCTKLNSWNNISTNDVMNQCYYCLITEAYRLKCIKYYYRQPCVATRRLCFTSVYYYFFLFTVRSQKLLDRFTQNFQELCILV